MTSPPDNSRARLLKLRRVQLELVNLNRDRKPRSLLPGNAGTSAKGLLLYSPVGSVCAPVKDSDVISMAIQLASSTLRLLHKTANGAKYSSNYFWGRTGFDSSLEAQTACRGWFVGLVKNRTKTNKRSQRRSRSRGLIDRDVFAVMPASGENVDSRLANRRSDRAGS